MSAMDLVMDPFLLPVSNLSRWFWDDEVWLPPNVTWDDLR